jgi:putative sterol carrier protein
MTNEKLLGAAQGFVASYHANATLCADHLGWDCAIGLHANDDGQQVTLNVVDGRVRALAPGNDACDLTVSAALAVLVDILELKLNPNQPYLFGELTVAGDEADFMRVDYIASRLCAR